MKKIKSLLFTFSLAAVVWSCGDAGFGFDVAAEAPVDAGIIEIDVPATLFGTDENLNQQGYTFDYDLNNVDGFQDAVDELNSAGAQVYILGVAYEVSGVNTPADADYDEEVPVEALTIEFLNVSGANNAGVFDIAATNNVLQNVSKTDLVISDDLKGQLESRLLSANGLDLRFIFDAGDVPTDSDPHVIDFDVTVYFDVAIRVRNINN
ncbi:MAG: hypothetical protein ABJP45_10110 [Cyclobacteriaceae bacterium]